MKDSHYIITKTDDGGFQCKLLAKNGRVILKSPKQKNIEDTFNSMNKIKQLGSDMYNFEFLRTKDNKMYFNIVDSDKVIAKSNLYKSERGLFIGCNIVLDNCNAKLNQL